MNERVQQYINSLPADRKALFEKLQGLILGMYPKAEVLIWYGMPTYRAKAGWVALYNQRNFVSLYTNSPSHIAEFKAKYPGIKTAKACLNFRVTDPVPVTAVRKVIRHAMLQLK